MTAADIKLLSAIRIALDTQPLADQVRVLGQSMSRDMARAMERNMSRAMLGGRAA